MKQLLGFTEQTWLYIDQIGILISSVLMCVSMIGAVVSVFKRNEIRRWFRLNRFPAVGGKKVNKDWDGLVFTVSRNALPIWVIEQIQPKWVGLLSTPETQAEQEKIAQAAAALGILITHKVITDADDPQESFQQGKSLLHNKPPEIDNVAVDITGGKTPMSLGAFMAAEELGVDSIYVTAEYQNGRPVESSARIIGISQN